MFFKKKWLNLRVERFSLASSVPQHGVDPSSLHGTGQLSASILKTKGNRTWRRYLWHFPYTVTKYTVICFKENQVAKPHLRNLTPSYQIVSPERNYDYSSEMPTCHCPGLWTMQSDCLRRIAVFLPSPPSPPPHRHLCWNYTNPSLNMYSVLEF